MVASKFIKIIFLFMSAVATAQTQDIPFDANVPETGAGTGAENAPPPPPQTPAQAGADNATPEGAPPPPAMAQPAQAPNKAAELNGPEPTQNNSPPPPPPEATGVTTGTTQRRVRKTVPAELSGLGKLAPFSDIAVITKRFLPKTHRFEFFPNFGLIMNDAFFTDLVMGGRLGYYFTENWGIEVSGMSMSTSPKGVTTELQSTSNYGVQTTSLSTATSYIGGDVKWDPIYGKLAFLNKSIVPFDFYFSGGGGITGTSQGSSAPTIHIGAGQLFAISKWLAGRWDISWYGYSATSVNGSSSFFTNLHATIGVSFFFPGAEYR
jgi:outer membrane beta-barrel protein